MVITGLRLVIGSWKIMATSLPRTSRIVCSGIVRRSRPPSWMLPSMRPFCCGTRRMMESAVTLLPEPDSPTIATVCFAATSNDTLRTTGTHCPSRTNEVVRPVIDSTGVGMVSVSPFTIHAAWQGFAAPMTANGLQHEFNRRFRRRHACDMRRQENARIAPERMVRRQRLRFGDVENGGRQHAAFECVDQIGFDQMAASPDIEQSRTSRQALEQACVQDAARLVRQRQQA